MRLCLPALFLVLAACDAALPTDDALDSRTVDGRAPAPDPEPPAFDGACGECAFEPRLYTRTTGTPVTDVIAFSGHPDGAYVLETNDFGDRGAESRIVLNDDTLRTPTGLTRRDVVLGADNELRVRLTGKPGSRLRVRLYQEIASVEVTPATPRARIPATQQFTATARDRNGVAIPRVTFAWESAHDTIASIDAASGRARSEGPRHQTDAWSYITTSLGIGDIDITARPDNAEDATELSGSATWSLVNGFVYTTYRAPRRTDDTLTRAMPQPFSYDEARLQQLKARCEVESANQRWWDADVVGEDLYKQCYPEMETTTPHRTIVAGVPVPGTPRSNVGLYGRYCGGGHPGGPSDDETSFIVIARGGHYDPKDAIDAICMEHDRARAHHDEAGSSPQGACIVRYGIEHETLLEDGVPVPQGSERWDAFWARWPEMAAARLHWLVWTRPLCDNPAYARFLSARGLSVNGP